ncbi:hypothetical protein GCM10009558_072530 [Virgisporangium aurantiacum]
MSVPWPFSSQLPSPPGVTRSVPRRTLPANMACSPETPESITATVTPAPVLNGQARSGRSRFSAHGSSASGSATTGPQVFGAAAATPGTASDPDSASTTSRRRIETTPLANIDAHGTT